MICYENQSISKLHFYLLKTGQPPDGIQVLKHRHIQKPNYGLDLRVVGTSHALSIATQSSTLTEIIACSRIDETHPSVLKVKQLCQSDGHAVFLADLRYSVKWEIQRFSRDIFSQRARALHRREVSAFSYEFPAGALDSANAPLTRVEYVCHPSRIQIHTYHTYPNEFGIVVTQTHIELR